MSTVSHGLKQLADTIETLENSGRPVSDITTHTDEVASDDGLTAEFSVQIPLPFAGGDEDGGDSVFSPTAAEVAEDGTVQVSFEGRITDEDVESVRTTPAVEEGSRGVGGGGGVPPHRDPEALEAAYEQCDTFVEMKRALGTDVTPEAVRQQMVKHGIHEVPDGSESRYADETAQEEQAPEEPELEPPEESKERAPERSDDTERDEAAADSEDSPSELAERPQAEPSQPTQSTEVFVSDGGLQADLTVEELKEVVQTSRTLYEAAQELRVGREEARDMLDRLDLLDLVTGRLSTKDERTVTSEEIDRRIRSSNLGTA
jgi:hypothetical protein